MIILYHKNCADGFCAAWVSQMFVEDLGVEKVQYYPIQYGEEIEDRVLKDNDVLILDFSFSRERLLQIKAMARSLVVLDHHKTAAAELSGLDFCHFDMTKSGSRLAWEFWNGEIKGLLIPESYEYEKAKESPYPRIRDFELDCRDYGLREYRPWLVDYTEDRDLWRWKLPGSREINAGLASYPFDMETWDYISREGSKKLSTEGAAILRYQNQMIERAVKSATIQQDSEGRRYAKINATMLISETGERLLDGGDVEYAMLWFEDGAGNRVHSLRSRGDMDVAEIAGLFGGGGHKNAAGYVIKGL